ncbi:MAG: hypothetical protein ABEJ72_04060, partial [Candidatus Aenigmatarchaeota archaeon]
MLDDPTENVTSENRGEVVEIEGFLGYFNGSYHVSEESTYASARLQGYEPPEEVPLRGVPVRV